MASFLPPFRWIGAPASQPDNPDRFSLLHHHAERHLDPLQTKDPDRTNHSVIGIWDQRDPQEEQISFDLGLLLQNNSIYSFGGQAILGGHILPENIYRKFGSVAGSGSVATDTKLANDSNIDVIPSQPEIEMDMEAASEIKKIHHSRCLRNDRVSAIKLAYDGRTGVDVAIEHRLSPSYVVDAHGIYCINQSSEDRVDKGDKIFGVAGRWYHDRGTMSLMADFLPSFHMVAAGTHQLGMCTMGMEIYPAARPSVTLGCRVNPYEVYRGGVSLLDSTFKAIQSVKASPSISSLSRAISGISIDAQPTKHKAHLSGSVNVYGHCKAAYSFQLHPMVSAGAVLDYQIASQNCDLEVGLAYTSKNFRFNVAMDPFKGVGINANVTAKQYQISGQLMTSVFEVDGPAAKATMSVGVELQSD